MATFNIDIDGQEPLDDNNDPTVYQVGAGVYDLTGPAAETGMMGYAMVNQRTHGLHFRLRARTVIIEDHQGKRIVHTSSDTCMIYHAVKVEVIKRLQEKYGDMYDFDNVLLSGIHTHSGPGGYSWYIMYDITTFGFSKQNYESIVNGIVQSIARAHDSMRPAHIFVNQGKLEDSNINRSPSAYLMNPESERAMYPDGDTDKDITVLRFQDLNGKDFASMAWFAVHCTSMFNTNLLISGDNKGMASYLFERQMNGNGTHPGDQDGFIALFPQTNSGDVSPNTRGPSCPDGTTCDVLHSTCKGKNEGCQGKGPGKTDYESTQIIGTKQFQAAYELFSKATTVLNGTVDYRHQFVDMSNVDVEAEFTQDGDSGTTCRAAYGYSFAAGTTDGPGEFDFIQGDNNTQGNPFWNFVAGFIEKPTADQIKCQAPKPILLDVGQIKPTHWAPHLLPVQVFKIGQFLIPAVPAEFTTMSGRRARRFVAEAARNATGSSNHVVVLGGYANAYSGYVATETEYMQQRYEAASTIFGKFTLAGYIQHLYQMTTAMLQGKPVPAGPSPPDLSGHQISFEPPVIVDGHPEGKNFGSIEIDTSKSYKRGDTATAVFWGANPRNNLMTEATFLTVERKGDNNQWTVFMSDSHIETRYHWKRDGIDRSLITIEWDIPAWTVPGTYRIRTFGYSRDIVQKISPYSGSSSEFQVE
eukprot:TRINITY_DN103_c0_g1_i7.p1 TRINITY_DN103_c0_g1~~TRINITY_DN103_c0_g1_i7.p1  ORF type:complete len:696 (-),score=187.40 TRINITY_DN103_c0_g1_i7:605-2692(-)